MPKLLKRPSKSKVTVPVDVPGEASQSPSTTSKRNKVPRSLWSSATNPLESLRNSSTRDDSSSSGGVDGGKQVKRSSMGHAAGNFVKNTVMAPVVAGKAVVQGGVKAAQTVVNAGAAMGTSVSNSVAYGSKAVKDGGMAIVEGTSNAVSKGAKGVVQGIKNVTTLGGMVGRNQREKKSKWEEGIEVIDSLLDPSSETYQAMTRKQRRGLATLKKLLINGTSGGDKTQHIPRDLIQMNKHNESLTRSSIRMPSRVSTKFLLQEYAGVKSRSHLLFDLSEWDDLSESDSDCDSKGEELGVLPSLKEEKTTILRSLSDLPHNEDLDIVNYVPIEFKRMSQETQMKLFNMLSWDNLKTWDFDVFTLNNITRRRPLMFAAWAILGSPYSQKAMANHMGLDYAEEDVKGYPFMDEFMIPPDKLLDYLRIIELDYHAVNPYHNAIHATDVLQTLHTLIQSSLNEDFLVDCPNIKLFSILLAAVIHDVDHPGM